MKPLYRKPVSKHGSARKFVHGASKTKAANLRTNPMRGGYRL